MKELLKGVLICTREYLNLLYIGGIIRSEWPLKVSWLVRLWTLPEKVIGVHR